MTDDVDMKSVAIIGAGITGLTAAYRLHRENIPVTVYEASRRVGGPVHRPAVCADAIDGAERAVGVGAPQHGALNRPFIDCDKQPSRWLAAW